MADDSKPLIELFVKAAPSDKKEKGPCLIGEQWFMSLYCLVEKGVINLRVTPMTMDQPPIAYLNLNVARHLPVIWIESGSVDGEDLTGYVITSFESLETLMNKLKYPDLNPMVKGSEVRAAEKVFEDIYTDLMLYIKNDNLRPLMSVLNNLEKFLASGSGPYLLGDHITYADCQLMPKLQHVRVAGRAYKNFDIPHEFTHIWGYIKQMYELKAFTCSCPATRDILMHYDEKISLPKEIRPSLMGPECLFEIPEGIHVRNGNRS